MINHTLQIGAVIMASGASRRFGSNKLLADLGGRPLIRYVLDAVARSSVTKKVIVTRTPQIQELCMAQNYPCILHELPLLNDTIQLGLRALLENSVLPYSDNASSAAGSTPSLPDGCIFLQGDQPLLTPQSIDALILAFSPAPHCICRLSCKGVPGSPVLFPKELFGELLHLPPDCGGGHVIRSHTELVRLVEANYPYEMLDADTPGALEHLRRILPEQKLIQSGTAL